MRGRDRLPGTQQHCVLHLPRLKDTAMARRSHSEPHPEPEFMSLSDAGALIGYSTDTLKKRIEEGRLAGMAGRPDPACTAR